MKKKKQLSVTPIAEKMDAVHLTPEEGAELVALDKNIASVLIALGNHEVAYLARKNSLLKALEQAQQSFNSRTQAVADAHNIDKGKWVLDIPNMVFSKQTS